MRILALDQARNGGWSVFDYEQKKVVDYGGYSFDVKHYTYAKAVLEIEKLMDELIKKYKVSAVFLEDIQCRVNMQAFKKLAQLQGVLVNYCEKHDYLYGLIAPSQWQNLCRNMDEQAKEVEKETAKTDREDRKASKQLSIKFVKDQFGIETDNDNVADALCIGNYACRAIAIKPSFVERKDKK